MSASLGNPHEDQRGAETHVVGGLRVLCGTWNVNQNLVGLESLSAWICPTNSNLPAPHIVAVSLQEIVDLKDLKHYVNDDDSKTQVFEWGEAIVATLKERYLGISFSVMKRASLVGTCLIVIIQTHLLRYVRDVKKAKIATGTFGVLGNKGGCGIRFRLLSNGTELSLCFVGLHLSAHQREVAKRNQDWDNIIAKLNFNEQEVQHTGKRRSPSQPLVLGLGEYETGGQIMDHDVVFVMGDLNYRIDAEDQLMVLDLIRKRDLVILRGKDQLTNEMKSGHVAKGFIEPPITFPPTYKFQPGTSKYETRAEKKKRIPAWCDRVLFFCRDATRPVKCERYRACPSLLSSDHKPVSAEFYLGWISPPPAPMPSPRAIASTINPPTSAPQPSSSQQQQQSASRAPLGQFAVAVEAYSEGGMDLKPGDRFEVLTVYNNKTLLGIASGEKVGFVPSSVVKLVGVFESRATEDQLKQATELVMQRKRQQKQKGKSQPSLREPPLIDVSSPSKDEVKVIAVSSEEENKSPGDEDDDDDDDDDDSDEEDMDALVIDSGWLRANMDFTARREDEVSFRAGEMVEILSQDSGLEGWWIARVRNFDQGLVPAFCFQAKTNEIRAAPSMHTATSADSPMTFSMRHRTFSFDELDPNKLVAAKSTAEPSETQLLNLNGGGK